MPAEREYSMTGDGMRKLWEDLWGADSRGSWDHWEMVQNIPPPRRQRRIKSHKARATEVEKRDGRWFLKGDPRQGKKEVITRDRVCDHLIEQWSAYKCGWKKFVTSYMEKFTGTTRQDLRALKPYLQAISERGGGEDALMATAVAQGEHVTATPIQITGSTERYELTIDYAPSTLPRDCSLNGPTPDMRDGTDGRILEIRRKRKQGHSDDQVAADPLETMIEPLILREGMHCNQQVATMPPLSDDGGKVLKLLITSNTIISIIGAGFSEAAGLPTFRGKDGFFQKFEKKIFEERILRNGPGRKEHHSAMGHMAKACRAAKPTNAHLMLAHLASLNRLQRNYTQNIDGLDTQIKELKTIIPLPEVPPWPITIPLHGSLDYTVCKNCRRRDDLIPENHIHYVNLTCTQCLGVSSGKRKHQGNPVDLFPGIVLYCDNDDHDPRQHNPDHDAQVRVMEDDERNPPKLVIVVGCSCELGHIKGLIKDLGRSDETTVVWINPDNPPESMVEDKVFDIIAKVDCQDLALHYFNYLAKQG